MGEHELELKVPRDPGVLSTDAYQQRPMSLDFLLHTCLEFMGDLSEVSWRRKVVTGASIW